MNRIERINAWENNETAWPHHIEIYPTNNCNLNCKFCGTTKDPNKQELSDGKWFEIIKEIMKTDVESLYFLGGGEPLMRPKLFDKIFSIEKGDKFFSMVTNLTLLNEESILKLVEFGWDEITVSLDGIGNVHDYLRGKDGTFEIVKRNVQLINEAKNKLNKNKPHLKFHSVLTCHNYNKLMGVIELAQKLNIKEIQLDSLDTSRPEVKNLEIKEDQLKEFQTLLSNYIRKLKEYEIMHNYENFISNKFTQRGGSQKQAETISCNNPILDISCLVPWLKMVISPYGEITPCCVGSGSCESGKFEQSFEFSWKHSKYFCELRENMKKGIQPNYCKYCAPELLKETLMVKEQIKNEGPN